MKKFHELKFDISYLLFSLIILLLIPIISTSFTTYTTILYFKTDGVFKEMKHFNNNNILKQQYNQDDFIINDDLYMVEVEDSFYGEKIQITWSPGTDESTSFFHIGFLVKIEDYFLEIQDPELTVKTTKDLVCSEETTFIELNTTYSEEIKYCKRQVDFRR